MNIFQRGGAGSHLRPRPREFPGVHKPPDAGAKIHEMRQKYIKGKLCGNCCEETGDERNEGCGEERLGEKRGEGGGRWPPSLRASALSQAGSSGTTPNPPLQMTP